MTRLVSLLGASPGTLHTTLCKLLERGLEPSEVIVIATLERVVEEALRVAEACPCPGSGEPPLRRGVSVEARLLGFRDVETEEDLEQLRRVVGSVAGPNTVVDVSGGRKAMSIAAALEAYRRRATVVATIVPWEEQRRIQDALSRPHGLCEATARAARLLML